ncbi:MAG TPA: cytochrome P450 [Acidimicrobiales bacterium]|nr:cytochrome P450 [Acidimicrobiales bacterium]
MTPELRYGPLDPGLWLDPYPLYARLRDEDPVHFVADRGFFVLSRFADVFAAATDTATFSSASGLTFEEDEITKLGLAPTLVMMDRPRHTDYRRLVNRMFTPRAVADLEPAVRAFARDRLERIAEAGTADFVAELAGPLPSLVVASYLGVPESDRTRFGHWSSAIVQANASGSIFGAKEALAELYGYFTDLLERRRAGPGADMLSVLATSTLDGRPVTVEEVLGFCFVMIAGGNDTASGLLSGMAAALTADRDERALLLDDPGLVPGAVEELLRYLTPVQGLSRTTTRAVTLHGTTVDAGTKVHLLYGSANRDEREFGPDAAELRVRRRAPRMLAFSSGPHHCLGAAAARLQGRVVLEELLRAMPEFSADPAGGTYAPGPFTRRFDSLPIEAGPRKGAT